MKKELLRLFNSVQVDYKDPSLGFMKVIGKGLFVHASIPTNNETLNFIQQNVSISSEEANSTFHKSWDTIANSSNEYLIMNQIAHYISTYGYESLGIYSENTVYIPKEAIDYPEIKDDIPCIYINALTKEEVLEKIIDLGSGIALAEKTLNDVMVIIEANKYDSSFISEIKNRELKARLNDLYNIVPTDPTEYLRYVIAKLTDESLVIKNNQLIEKIKEGNSKLLDLMLKDAPEDLASIFFRYKSLFLAMKTISKNKTFFNKLRKKAKKLHKPLNEDFLNNVTKNIFKGSLDFSELESRLTTANIFRKVRLANALKFRLNPSDSIVHKVRNGKGWVKEFNNPLNGQHKKILLFFLQKAYNMVVKSIADDIKENVEGTLIYIPKNVNYTVPATEKQFVGVFPNGTNIEVPNEMIVGINWKNQHCERIDLDLSIIGESGKLGWDSGYRNDERSILFSGDITDGCGTYGATESFLVRGELEEPKILKVNDFSDVASKETPLEYKLFVASDKLNSLKKNYTVDPNKIIACTTVEVSERQSCLGLVSEVDGVKRFYFCKVSTGNGITSRSDEKSNMAREYLIRSCQESLTLEEVLIEAGGIIINEIPKGNNYVDLSPKNLTKDSIINLLK
jgi:hypothetical protein